MLRKVIYSLLFALLAAPTLMAQDNIVRERFAREPSFGIFHDNYFATGIPTNRTVDKNSADVKFQISIRQILFKELLPRDVALMLTYTQKSFWSIYRKSSPFSDNNYNPGLSAVMPITRNGRLVSTVLAGFEHESNGKDSLDSRSINYFVLSGTFYWNHFSAQVKVWPGWTSKESNPDYFKYKGYGLLALNYHTENNRFRFSAIVTPRDRFRAFNTTLEANFQLRKRDNQYVFVQWHQGCAEGMLNYKQYTSMIRVGICIKPTMLNYY